MKRSTILNILLLIQLVFSGSIVLSFITAQNSYSQDKYVCGTKFFGNNNSFPRVKVSAINYENATIISDGYLGKYWNTGEGEYSSIAVDNLGNIYVVWEDTTEGIWGGGLSDYEIMYANYSVATGIWSNATVISDGYQGSYWNTGGSYSPSIAIDNLGNLHVVWQDDTPGKWGIGAGDDEIMYANYSVVTGQWSNATVISDGYNDQWGWNTEYSYNPSIGIDKNSRNLHVAWEEHTPGKWTQGSEPEVMYANYTIATGKWSNVTVISDGYQGIYWNTGFNWSPTIAVDNSGNIYVVWETNMVGIWGFDIEVMYANYSVAMGKWSNATVISDGYQGAYWNNGNSYDSSIVVDNSGNLYVVWYDNTNGIWSNVPNEYEVMYVKYSVTTGKWSNATIISDGYQGVYWNIGNSMSPSIAVDTSKNLLIVWEDLTDGKWGADTEIMYVKYSVATGQWSNATVISDGYQGSYWNTGGSYSPSIAIDNLGNLHVVWSDDSPGIWRDDTNDFEILYTKIIVDSKSGGIVLGDDDDDNNDKEKTTISSSNFYLLFITIGTIILVIYKKRKVKNR